MYTVGTLALIHSPLIDTPRYASTVTDKGARADIQVKGFWGTSHQCAFLISRYLTHTYHPTRRFSSLPAMPIMNKSNGACMSRGSIKLSWHPSSTTGGMGKSATVFYGRLADRIATKTKQPYSSTFTWIQCRLNFSLIRSLVSCLR